MNLPLYKHTVTTTMAVLLGYGSHGNTELTTCHRSTLTQFTKDTVLLGGGSRGCYSCGLGSGWGHTRSFSPLHRERRRMCVCVGGGGVETIQKGGMHDEGEVNDRRSEVRRDQERSALQWTVGRWD